MTAAAAFILALFIIITEISIAKLTRVAMQRYADAASTEAMSAPQIAAAVDAELSKLRKPVSFYLVIGAVSALLLTSFAVSRLVIRPLKRVNEALQRVGEGRLGTTIPLEGTRELAELGGAFNRMTRALKEQDAELMNRLLQIERSALELKIAEGRLIQSAKLASIGTLAAGVAHEIGNPLTGLLGLVESIEAGVDKEDEAKFLSLMRREILRIDRIIRDLLSYARTSNDNDGPPPFARPADVLDHVRSLLAPQPLFDRIEWTVPDLSAISNLAISEDDLTQVLLNLCLNAAHAMNGKGRITIDLSTLSAWRRSSEDESTQAAAIRIFDTGPGISDANADRIFDPFFTTKSAGTSCGLGLSVCQALIDRAEGTITLDRSYLNGACFVVTLPHPRQSPALTE